MDASGINAPKVLGSVVELRSPASFGLSQAGNPAKVLRPALGGSLAAQSPQYGSGFDCEQVIGQDDRIPQKLQGPPGAAFR